MKLIYPACFYEDPTTNEYAVVVPDLQGCTTGGSNLSEAIEMAIDAASGWILTALENGESIPKPTDIKDVKLDYDFNPGGKTFVSIISLDMKSYAEKYGDKAVRKNLTIPAWLNTFAEEKHINFSETLQKALTDIYKKTACL